MTTKYISSQGVEFEFYDADLRVTSGNYHIRKWNAIAAEARYGDVFKGFGKESITYALTFTLRGSLEDRKETLDQMIDMFERDIIEEKPGRLTFGDMYIECFAIASDTHLNKDMMCRTDVDVEFYCPYPFWIRDYAIELPIVEEPEGSEFLDYPFDYSYDYAVEVTGRKSVSPHHFSKSEFMLTVYGPAENPKIVINGIPYKVNVLLGVGEVMVIDSRKKTIVKGSENILHLRDIEHSVFTPIDSYDITIAWSGDFRALLDVYLERSEPTWT